MHLPAVNAWAFLFVGSGIVIGWCLRVIWENLGRIARAASAPYGVPRPMEPPER